MTASRHLSLFAALLAAACSDDQPLPTLTDAGAAPAAAGRPAPKGLAVISSDFQSATLSLVGLGGAAVSKDVCFGSGSAGAPTLSAALSDDVVLPSQTQPGNRVVLIDRKLGVLTWLEPKDGDGACQPLRQMNVGPGWSSNPHDLVGGLGGGKGYVLRYGRNPAKAQGDEGQDLLIIDTDKGEALGRIDLGPWASPGSGGKPILPYPDRALALGDRVYVALNNLSEAFDDAGAGRIVVVDATRDAVVNAIDLPGLKNCGTLSSLKLTDGSDALAVGCGGAYSDGAKQIDGAGVALVNLGKQPAEVSVVPARGFGRPVSGFALAVLAPDQAFTVINGDGKNVNDAIWAFDFTDTIRAGGPRKLIEGSGSYVLSLAADRERGTLYVLDATTGAPQIHVYNRAQGEMTRTGGFPSSPATGLPPRQLAYY